MSDQPKRPLAEMQAAADRLVDELAPFCERERIAIAGSIRRRAPRCADVELVCIPTIDTERDPTDLFRTVAVNRLDVYCRAQLESGRYAHRLNSIGSPAFGPRFKRLLVDGVPLDLFSVLAPAAWAMVLLIRTGSAAFSQRAVTRQRNGGLLPDDCRVVDGAVWRGAERIELADETDFFALCGVAYVELEARG